MLQRVVWLVSVVLALMVVFLARQNLQLKQQLAELRMSDADLGPGERLGPIQLVDPTGENRPLAFPREDERTVLLVFTPGCPACRATLPVWQALFRSLDTSARVLGVNIGTPAENEGEGLVTFGLPFPVFGVVPEQSEGLREITYVPATLILDGSGIVQQVWFGELDERQQDELRRELSGG